MFAIHSDSRTSLHNPSDAIATREEAEVLFGRWDEHWRRFGFGYWVVRRLGDESVLGFCGLKFMTLGDRRVLNLFCRLDPAAWGRGIGSEASQVVLRWARESFPDVPVVARCRPGNVASRRLAQRLGLERAEHLDEDGEDGADLIFVSHWDGRTAAD